MKESAQDMDEDELTRLLTVGVLGMAITIASGFFGWLKARIKKCMPKKQGKKPHKPHKLATLKVSIVVNGNTFQGGDMPVTLPVDTTATGTLSGVDKKGNDVAFPAPFDAPPAWVASDPALVVIAPAADGLSALLTPAGPAGGKFTVTVTGAIAGKTYEGVSDEIDLAAGTLAALKISLAVQ